MKRVLKYDRFVLREFECLIEFLVGNGGSFHPCLELGRAPKPRGIAFRYDVHPRDVVGAYDFVAAHRRFRVPATFFLLMGFRENQKRDKAFVRLARRLEPPLSVGLHDSPVDAFLLARKFQGREYEYRPWLHSEESPRWFGELCASDTARDAFHDGVMAAFAARLARARARIGPIETVASHGGGLQKVFRRRVAELGTTGAFISSLFAENWMTENRLAALGLVADVEQFKLRSGLWCQVTDGGGQIQRMIRTLKTAIDRNSGVQVLIHPYTWAGPLSESGGTRDGELSVLLGGATETPGMGGRKWWQAMGRMRFMMC
jgi:hypothetical protein